MGCHFLLQGIYPTQRLNLCPLHPLHCRQILYQLSHQGSHHVSKCLLIIVPFPSTSETTRHTEKQKHREIEPESEPESDITGMLELSDEEFLKMVINMLRDLT